MENGKLTFPVGASCGSNRLILTLNQLKQGDKMLCASTYKGEAAARKNNEYQVLDRGILGYEGNRITFVGFPDDPRYPSVDPKIRGKQKRIPPVLINLHSITNLGLQLPNIDQALHKG